MWESKAKGLFTKKLISSSDLSGKDFLIARYDDSFHTNVQTAYDNNIPCFLFYENNPELLELYGLDESHWTDDKNEDLQNIINAIMVGGLNGVPRAIQGVMIDCSRTITSAGKTYTVQWLTQTATHLMNRVWSLLKIPVYIYMNMNPVYTYKNSLNDIETLYQFISNAQGISTVDWATINSSGVPIDSERPVLPYDDGQPWQFWFYHVDSNVNIDVLHFYDKTTLYSALGYTPTNNSGSSGDSGDSGDSGSSGDSSVYNSEILTELQKQTLLLQQMLTIMQNNS